MSEDSAGENPFKPMPRRWSRRRKAIVAVLVVFATGFGVIAWKLGPYFYWRYSAQQRVNAEIARLKAAGEPLTADELHAQYKVPEGTPDLTAEWSKALGELNAVLPTVSDPEFQNLPLIRSDRTLDDLEPTAANACLESTEAFLERIEPQVQALLDVASKSGEVRFPVKFEDHLAALLTDAELARYAGRVLAIRARIGRIRQDGKRSEESIAALIALTHTLDHSRTLVEQLVRCSLSRMACDELNDAANHVALSSEQLSRLASQLELLDFKKAAWNCFTGERVIGWGAMDVNASFVADDEGGLTTLISSAGPVDRAFFLRLYARAVHASQLDYQEAAAELDSINQDLRQLSALPPLEKMHYLYSALLFPSAIAAHVGIVTHDARCNVTLVSLSANRFRERSGRWPQNVDELREVGLPADCIDPFTGNDLVIRADGEDLIVYSIGADLTDDGGTEEDGRSRPDVTVRIAASK